jgi:hypothetical protein
MSPSTRIENTACVPRSGIIGSIFIILNVLVVEVVGVLGGRVQYNGPRSLVQTPWYSGSRGRSDKFERQNMVTVERRNAALTGASVCSILSLRSNFAYFDTIINNAIFGNLGAQVRTLYSECVSGGLRLVFLSCLDSADECSTTSGGFHVSAKAEPLVAHRVCHVCRYCNDGVATRTMRKTKLGSNARSVAVQVPASLDPTVDTESCMYECKRRLHPISSLGCGSKVHCRVRTGKLLPVKPYTLYPHRNLARGEVVHERSRKDIFRHIRSSNE